MPSNRPSWRLETVSAVGLLILLLSPPAPIPAAPAANRGGRLALVAKASVDSESGYVHQTITVHGEELSTLLHRLHELGIRLPISASGRVNASFRLGIPWRHPLTWDAYRLEGFLTGPDVTIEGIRLHDLYAGLLYTEGELKLEKLSFTLWDAARDQPGGTFAGTGNLQVSPRGDLAAHLSIEDLNAAELARLVPNLPPIAAGRITGALDARVPFERIKDPTAWHADGQIAIDGLSLADLPPARIAANFQLDGGNLTLSDLNAVAGGTRLRADARIDGHAPFSFQIELRQVEGQFSDLSPLLRQLGIPEPLSGTVTATGTAHGNVQPFAASATGSVDLDRLAFRGARVDRVHVEFSGDQQRASITRFSARLYGGTASGSATFSFAPQPSGRADVNWQAVAVGALLGDLFPRAANTAALSRGNVTLVIPLGSLESPAQWQATGSANLDGGVVMGVPIRGAGTSFEIRSQMLNLSRLQVDFATGWFQANASVALRAPLATTGTFNLRDFELSQLAAPLGFRAADLAGRVNLGGTAKGNLADAAISARGTGSVSNSNLLGMPVDSALFGFGVSRYGLALKNLTVRFAGGAIRGSAVLPADSRVVGNVDLTWTGIDVGRLMADLRRASQTPSVQSLLGQSLSKQLKSVESRFDQSLSGLAGGKLSLTLPMGHDLDWHQLSGAAHLDLAQLAGFGIQNGQIAVDAALDRGTLTLSQAAARWNGFLAAVNARIALAAPFDFAANLTARGRVESLPKIDAIPLADSAAGDFRLRADLQGSVSPLDITGDGAVSVGALQIGKAKIDSFDARFVADRKTINVRRLQASFEGGLLEGSAVLPFSGQVAGEASLHLNRLDVGRLAAGVARLPIRLNAVTTADLQAKMPPGTLDDPAQWDMRARADIPSFEINALPVGDLHLTATCRHDTLDYSAQGHLIGGLANAVGRWSADQDATANSGLVELKQLELGRLVAAFPRARQLQGLVGTVDLHVPFTLPSKFAWPEGSGELKLSDLRWQNIQLTDRIDGLVNLRQGILEIERIEGTFAQGMLRASCSLDLNQPRRSRVRATLSDVASEQLLTPWPELKGVLAGPVDVDLRGVLARPWRFVATVGIEEGKVLAVPLTGFRLPLRIDFDPRTLAAEVDTDDGSGQLGHGRLQFKLRLRSTGTIAVDFGASLTDADLGPLLSRESYGQLAGGRVSGTIALSGQNVRSLNDLSGNLKAHLRNVQATALPVLQNLEPYLTGGLASAGSNDGDVRARIGNGILQLEKLTINTASARLFASGRVSQAGNLDLGVAVSIYPLPGGAVAPALLARLPLAAVAGPVGLLVTANELLANRVIYLDVTGTISNPVVRLRPLPLLTTEATRFFLGGGL
ncbi:MAG TPA: AsmA-like C-terminal region-containing protein [Pirellulales bacterium]|nr:AsmA-like C-terminal region-containing protein [Pirellulales bacterium]